MSVSRPMDHVAGGAEVPRLSAAAVRLPGDAAVRPAGDTAAALSVTAAARAVVPGR